MANALITKTEETFKGKGLICESFAFQVPAPDFALAVVKSLSHLAPHAHVLKLKTEDFSRDPKVIQTMMEDPLIEHEVQPTLTVAEMVRADGRLKEEFPVISRAGSRHAYRKRRLHFAENTCRPCW